MTELQRVRRWVAAAVLDGWDFKATYGHESVQTACTLSKKGFKAHVVMRPQGHTMCGTVNYSKDYVVLSVWGPDGLAVPAGEPYSWDMIRTCASQCGYCKRQGDTVRIGFAGRCCKPCREKFKDAVEHPGWAD